MDVEQHLVAIEGQEVNLSATEFRLLQLFLENPNKVLSKDQILNEVWGTDNLPTLMLLRPTSPIFAKNWGLP